MDAAVVGILSMMVGYFYTGGPYPIAYTPFGELFSGVVMGMLLILIAFYIQTGTVTTEAILLSIPSMLLVAGIMMSNNIRDLEGDKEGGRKTLAILVGRSNAITILMLFFIISYVWIIALILFGHLTPWALLVFLSVKKPIRAISTFRKNHLPITSDACDEKHCNYEYFIRITIRYRNTYWISVFNLILTESLRHRFIIDVFRLFVFVCLERPR